MPIAIDALVLPTMLIPPAYLAPLNLQQMFDKIIANAVDFSEKESEIQVSITVKDKQAELTISNTGPLLPEGMRSQLLQSMVSVRKEN